ncbi:MAG: cytochrome P450 [Solirubrobacterales bacterium]
MTDDFRIPDGPKTNGAYNAFQFLARRTKHFGRLQREYGDVFSMHLPTVGTIVVVADPDCIKQIFIAPSDVLHAGKNPLGEVLGPGSLFSMDEQRHLDERRLLLPAFHGDRLSAYSELIEGEALAAMSGWPDDEPFATISTFNQITLRVILRAVFGADGEDLALLEREIPPGTKLGQRLVALRFLRRDFGRFSPGGRFKRYRALYDEIVGRLVDERLADPDLAMRADVLSQMILGLRERDSEIDRSEIADELLTLLVAGHETTASSLAWAVERLSRHPEAVRRLEQEIRDGGSELLTATILELQRHRTIIAGVARLVNKPFEFGQWRVPPGVVLVPASSNVHLDGRIHRSADEFQIDRFLGEKPGTYNWIPFGGGVRRCIGSAFAQLEMEIVLRTLIGNFEILPTDAKPEKESFRGVAFAPSKGGVGRFRRRALPLVADAHKGVAAGAVCPVDHVAVATPLGAT